MKRALSPSRSRKLTLENLEGRAMLATASVAGGMLYINGDNTAENVIITQEVDGRIQVTGVLGEPRLFSGVTSIYADLKGGNDSIMIGTVARPIPLIGAATVLLGSGSDNALVHVNTLSGLSIDGGFETGSGPQNEIITIENTLAGSISVNTWAGNDLLTITQTASPSLVVNLGSEVLFGGQTDDDSLVIQGSAFGIANILLGTGGTMQGGNLAEISSTLFGSLTITGGSGVDEVIVDSIGEGIGGGLADQLVNLVDTLEPVIENLLSGLPVQSLLSNIDSLLGGVGGMLGNVTLPGGIGIDDVVDFLDGIDLRSLDLSEVVDDILSTIDWGFIGDDSVTGNVTIRTLGGSYYVDLDSLTVIGNVTVDTGEGNDGVYVDTVDVSSALWIFLGGGTDRLDVLDSESSTAFLDGGLGFDTRNNIALASPNLGLTLAPMIFNFDTLALPT